MKKTLTFILSLAVTLTVGAIAGIATASSVDGWYYEINKPAFNPPNYLFGPVWTVLYILLGISLFLVLNSEKAKKRGLIIFGVQLALNFLWSFIFFKWQLLGLAFVEIIMLWFMILGMVLEFYRINKVASLINIPYLLWVAFATVLNGSIWYLN